MDIQHQILEKIKAYDTIMLFRHSRVDGDCVGATVYSTDEAAALIADADEAVREYKAAHENWL